MTPKEKAIELVDKIYFDIDFDLVGMPDTKRMVSRQCVLIAVDEIIKETKLHDLTIYDHGRTGYWEQVKKEIEKL